MAQIADVLLQILAFRKVLDDFFELGAGVAVALALEEEPHHLQSAFEVAGFHGGGENAVERLAGDAAGGDSHVPDDRLGAADEAFDLGVERRDLGDALHDGKAPSAACIL